MKVPFLDLRTQYLELREEIDEAVLGVLDSGWYIQGKKCEEFELAFKGYLVGDDEGYVVGVNSGTDALKLSLLAAGIGPGDEVITVANTAIPTATAICSVGAIPVFCDVDRRTWLMDAVKIGAHVTSRTKAIIPVHLYGGACDMNTILEVAGKFGLQVIEDTAQATGSLYKGKKCGTLGHYGAFSFYPSKNLGACGDGGAVFVRSADSKELLSRLRNYGQGSRYRADMVSGENSRLDELQAAILSIKLRHLDRWNRKKVEVASCYLSKLHDCGFPVQVQMNTEGAEPAKHLFVVRVDPRQRERIMKDMEIEGVQSLIHYPMPLDQQPAFSHYKKQQNAVAEELCASVISLPFHQYLAIDKIDYIIASFARASSRNA